MEGSTKNEEKGPVGDGIGEFPHKILISRKKLQFFLLLFKGGE